MKNLKSVVIAMLVGLLSFQANAIVSVSKTQETKQLATVDLTPGQNANIQTFLSLTPAKYEQMTGKKMNLVSRYALKVAQKKMSKELMKSESSAKGASLPKIAYILLALFGLGFIGIGIVSDWQGNDWWINLLLTFLFWLPGFIHALIVMGKYY
ncbi:MAG: YqaE/Pmp3 family membrane protein [Saprospiraceae bacterium]|jgi:uncharacterized membrane protein YqaE (UPF0057 family)|nr:YqaE/Pmp3 family membrane protein [Saprospiraceae bacterium]